MRGHTFYVYILSSRTRVLYTGVTNDLRRRLAEHQVRHYRTFTGRYGVNRLVYFERFRSILVAIAREKEIKRWRREKRVWLIEGMNPGWRDLGESLFRASDPSDPEGSSG